MNKIVSWDREFQVWQYSVSHSVLMLRSFHPQRYETRIDVAFPAVELMHLQPSYQGLSISRLAGAESLAFLHQRGLPPGSGKLFLLNDGDGYVQAADCQWHEDQGDHHTPSRFGPLRGTE